MKAVPRRSEMQVAEVYRGTRDAPNV